MNQVKFVKTHPEAQIPKYAKPGDSGMDLCSVADFVIWPGERLLINTGLKMELPTGYEGQVRPRSGLAINCGLTVLNSPGTIDNAYRGLIKVILYNASRSPYKIKVGDRIAQLVIAPVVQLECVEVETLSETERGEGGMGSTGVR